MTTTTARRPAKPASRQGDDCGHPSTSNRGLHLAFAVLIVLVICVGSVGLNQMARVNAWMQDMGRTELVTIELAREALKLSARNNRITMQVFLLRDRSEIDRLLGERATNTDRITALINRLEGLTDRAEETRLLEAVKAAQAPYVESSREALKLHVEGGDPEGARRVMTEKTIPRLEALHTTWEAFSQFETEQMAQFVTTSETRYRTARAQTLELLSAASLCALAIAFFSSRRLAFEIGTREQAETDLRQANRELETRVSQRTAALAEANVHLAASLAERTKADEELERAHRQLLDVSRQAGMAEVASSVLHNVGNVLNSANVSLEIGLGKVRGLKVASLEKLAALLREHRGELPSFFASHPQGGRFPDFLAQLSAHFSEEKAALTRELNSLRTNVEHINEIVSMQQRYAGAGGVIEVLPIADVIEDALRINGAALDRHGARVQREIDPTLPTIPIDRHKVLQILINLIRNAKYAMDEAPTGEKSLTLRASRNGDRRVHIAVIDTGIGIPPENLPRLFEHGFTTKKTGHGFGLHASAQAAVDLGGSLRVQSDGPGRGATFTLELPCQPQDS